MSLLWFVLVVLNFPIPESLDITHRFTTSVVPTSIVASTLCATGSVMSSATSPCRDTASRRRPASHQKPKSCRPPCSFINIIHSWLVCDTTTCCNPQYKPSTESFCLYGNSASRAWKIPLWERWKCNSCVSVGSTFVIELVANASYEATTLLENQIWWCLARAVMQQC